ncbi:hypothetical protein GJ496_005949 [Pomphorhynchus laevis]|nr:hypothetical protein GJ496_005949 [Pomphorhynchus laevis]
MIFAEVTNETTSADKDYGVKQNAMRVDYDGAVVALPLLNMRFRDYLSKIKLMSQVNKTLSDEFAKKYSLILNDVKDTSNDFHRQLQIRRHAYMCSYADLLNFNSRYKRYASKCQQLHVKIAMLENERNLIIDGKTQLTEKIEANKNEIDSLIIKIRNVQKQNGDLKAKMLSLEDEKDEIEEKLKNKEALRVQNQLNNEFIRSEIVFTRMIYDEIIGIFKKAINAAIKDGNFSQFELKKAKSEIRAEFARRTERELDELGKDYQTQYDQIKASFKMSTYEYKRSKSLDAGGSGVVADGDFGQLEQTIFETQQQLGTERHHNTNITNKLENLENELEHLVNCNRESLEEKDNLVRDARSQVMEMIMKIHRLKAMKCTLQSEIETYRKLLCDEEHRIAHFQRMRTKTAILGFGKLLYNYQESPESNATDILHFTTTKIIENMELSSSGGNVISGYNSSMPGINDHPAEYNFGDAIKGSIDHLDRHFNHEVEEVYIDEPYHHEENENTNVLSSMIQLITDNLKSAAEENMTIEKVETVMHP